MGVIVVSARRSGRRSVSAHALLVMQLRALKIPFETEYRFAPERRFRADVAFPDRRILAEVDGGIFATSRHTTGTGFTNDCVKMNLAAEQGWRCFRFTTAMVRSGAAITQLRRLLGDSARPGPASGMERE